MLRLLWTFCLLFPLFLSAQSDLNRLTRDLGDTMLEVQAPRATYSQALSVHADKPYVLVYFLTTINNKGKSTEEKWIFNLADIDPKTIQVEDSKEELRVRLKVQKGQKFIQYYRDGELSNYTDQFVLYGQGIDNARAIEGLLLEAHPLAATLWAQEAGLEGQTPQDLIRRLRGLVGDVSVGSTSFRQSLSPEGDFPDRLRLSVVESSSRKNEQTTYVWSLGDLKASSVRLQISGDDALVEAPMKDNLAWVYTERDGQRADFSKQVNIRVANADQGKLIVDILEQLISFGEEEIQKRLPDPGNLNLDELFERIAGSLGAFAASGTEVEMSLEQNCQSLVKERIGSDNHYEYAFHFGDLDPKTVKLGMDDDLIEIDVFTEQRNNYIRVMHNGEQENYSHDLEFLLGDLEKARLVAHLLPSLIELCPEEYTVGKFADARSWIAEGADVEAAISQTLSLQPEGDPCKWQYVWREEDEKKSSEAIYSFNAYDLDPDQVRISVSKKTVGIEVQTLKEQNIISSVVREKPGYVSTFSFEVPDIPTAKSLRLTLEQLIRGCQLPQEGE